MGILDKIVEATNTLGNKTGENPALLNGVIDIFKNEGVSGIVNKFKNQGMGEIVSSWVGKGPNMPISTDQIKELLGSEKLQELAKKAGVSEENASRFLKEILPGIIDKVTPGGESDLRDDAKGSDAGLDAEK